MVVRALCLVVAGALAVSSAGAQHRLPTAGVLFDDFHYRNTEPPLGGIGDRPLAENALFGANEWCLDLACEAVVPVRAWYWYNYFEDYFQTVDPLSAIVASADGPGTLDFVLRAGRHDIRGTAPRQIASGFAARTGVWAAAVQFSALPNGLPSDLRPPGAAAGRAPMMQSFWQIAPFKAVRTPDLSAPSHAQVFGTTEIDFEFNNWFYDAGRPRYMAVGFYENGDDPDGDGAPAHTMRLGAPGPHGDGPPAPYSCRIERTDAAGTVRSATVGSPDVCDAILAGADPVAGPHVPTVLVVRAEGSRTRFELRSTWATAAGRGAMRMETPWFEGAVQPSQLSMLMLSFYLANPDGEAALTVPAEQRMRVDWMYYTPDAGRTLDEVVADVGLIRRPRPGGRPAVSRLYTVPDPDPARSLARPYRLRTAADPEPAYESIVALDPLAVREVLGPRTARLDGRPAYVAVLDRRAGDYRFEWRYAPVRADGTAGTPGPYDGTSGFRWRPTFSFDGPAPPCVRVDLRVTRLEYRSGPAGVSWTSLEGTGRDRAEASVVTCQPGRPRPPGTGPG